MTPNSADSSGAFWPEYVYATRKAHGVQPSVDQSFDPMRVAIDGWYRTIDAATAKAVAEGFTHFKCSLIKSRRRIALRFRHPDGRRFLRTLPIEGRFSRHGRPLTLDEIIDLKVAIQTMIF
jgi:hypothetical protein